VTPEERACIFWSERLGCPPTALVNPGLTVVEHREPGRVYVFRTGESVVAAAPPELHERLREVADPASLVTPEVLTPLLPPGSLLVGPATIGYLGTDLRSPDGISTLHALDTRLDALRAAVTDEEWRHANLEAAELPVFAVQEDDRIVAVAGFERVLDRVAHIGVITDPRSRERGLGRLVTQAVAARAQALQLLPQFQTLVSNEGAQRIGRSLGFHIYAVTLAARLP
jgi:ribosomal protein S18 acetylase RimI-like enzyme